MPHPRLWRPFILAVSYFFYGWIDPRWVLLLIGSTVVRHVRGAGDPRSPSERTRRRALWGAIAFDLGLLGTFKYLGFFVSSTDDALDGIGLGSPLPLLQVCCPSASRSSPSRRSRTWWTCTGARRGPPRWATWPSSRASSLTCVAGPIVRANELLPQLRTPRDPRAVLAGPGLFLIAGGLIKKTVVADELGAPHRGPGVQRSRRALRGRDRCWRSTASPARSTATSPATRTWRSGSRCCSGSGCRRTSTARTWPQPARVLAPLAHDAVALAARLPLHPAGRQPGRAARAPTAT